MGLTKGIGLCNLKAFLLERFGDDAWEMLVGALPAADREVLARLSEVEWHDITLHGRAFRAACDVFAEGSLSLAMAAGRASAERNANGSTRFFYQFIELPFALRHMDVYWRRENDSGRFVAEIMPDHIVARLHDFEQREPAFCLSVLHHLGRILEYFGPVTSLEHPRCTCSGDDHCEFRAQFELGKATHTAGPVVLSSLPEVLGALQEIASTGDIDAVASGIGRLVHQHFGCPYVKLSILVGAAPHVISFGAPGGAPLRCFVLSHARETVGLLDLEMPPPVDSKDRLLLEEVIEWLGLVVGACGSSNARTARTTSVEDRERWAERAFSLTQRECDVLGLLAQGRSNKEIAQRLGIREKTIEVHVSKLLRKCAVDSRGALIAKFWSSLPVFDAPSNEYC